MTPMSQDKRLDEQVNAARDLLKPSPVRLCHVPDWFRRALLRLMRGKGRGHNSTTGWAVLDSAAQFFGWHWLDHHGSADYHGHPAFVSEPYHLSEKDVSQVAALANAIGCQWTIDANSYWFPGQTIRIAIYQDERIIRERGEEGGGRAASHRYSQPGSVPPLAVDLCAPRHPNPTPSREV